MQAAEGCCPDLGERDGVDAPARPPNGELPRGGLIRERRAVDSFHRQE